MTIAGVFVFRHASHIPNTAIEVRGRSYGNPVIMDQRGPQFVQLVKG
jgi:hypothetical protein